MATVTEKLQWLITANGDQAISAFQKVGKSAEKDLGNAEKKLDKVGSTMIKAGAGMVTAAGVAATALWKAGEAAGDLSAAISANEQVLGAASAATVKWAEGSVKAVGLSQRAAVEASTTFGQFAKVAGQSGQGVADFSIEMVKLASDMAAFKNVSPEQAIQDLSAAFAGSTETLGKYAITVNESSLKQAYFKETGEKVTGTLTAQQKAIALHADLMAKTVDIQGQWNREIGSAESKQAQAKASFENLQASIGQAFIPVMTTALDLVNKGIGAFKGLNDATGGAVGKVATVATVAVGAAGALSTLAGVAVKMRTSFVSAAGGLTTLGKAGLGIAAAASAVAIGVAVYESFGQAERRVAERTKEVAEALPDQIQKTYDLAAASAGASGEVDGLAVAQKALSDALTTGDEGEQLLAALGALHLQGSDTLAVLTSFKDEPVKAMQAIGESMGLTAQDAKQLAEFVNDSDKPFLSLAHSTSVSQEQFVKLAGALEQVQDSAENTNLDKLAQTFLTKAAATTKAADALVAEAEAQSNGATRTEHAYQVYLKYNELLGKLPKTQRDAILAGTEQADGLVDVAEASRATTAETDRLTASAQAEQAQMAQLAAATKKTADEAEDAQQAHEDLANEMDLEATAAASLNDELDRQVDALNADIEAHQEFIDAQRAAVDSAFAVDKAQADFNETLADTAKNVKDAGKDTAAQKVVYDELAQSAGALAAAHVQLAKDESAAAGKTLLASQAIDLQNGSLINAARQASGPARQAIIDYTAALNKIPEDVKSQISAAVDAGDIDEANRLLAEASKTRTAAVTVDVENASLQRVKGILADLSKDRTVQIRTTTQAGTARASGGPVRAGEAYLVGDGPGGVMTPWSELFIPSTDGTILSNPDTRKALQSRANGGSTGTPNITVTRTAIPGVSSGSGTSADDAIKEQDRLQAALFETNRISLAEYKQYVAGRLASSKDLSDDYLDQFRLLRQLTDTEQRAAQDRAQAAKDAADSEADAAVKSQKAQDDIQKAMFETGAISLTAYQEYLKGRLENYQTYSNDWLAVYTQIKALNDQESADQKQRLADSQAATQALYEQAQANKAVGEAEAQQAKQLNETLAVGNEGGRIQNDRNASAADKQAAVEDLIDAETKLADDTYRTILAKATAQNLKVGSVEWDRFVRSLLQAAIDTYNGAGLTVTGSALAGDLVGIPALAKGGIVKARPGGTLIQAGEGRKDEAVVPLDDRVLGGTTTIVNETLHVHLPNGYSLTNEWLATKKQAERRGFRG